MITRLPSLFFMLSLAFYYVPKLCKKQNKGWIKIHISTGLLAFVTMVTAMLTKVGTADLLKYGIFSLSIFLICYTGYRIPRQGKGMRKYHALATIGFFVCLFGSIIIKRLC